MPKKPQVFAYLALMAVSLPIPVLHQRLTDKAIESMRPIIRHPDGTVSGMLMPADILLLRWLGEISLLVACGVFVSFAISFRREAFSRWTTIFVVAICLCAFTTLYGFYAAFLLAESWLHRSA
jgi:hypothetical protein